MIINRRTSFTNLEYPNPFEDPEWTTWASIPNKEVVATATAGQSIAYKIPDGASGWYAMRVVPSGTDANSKVCASWGYTYLHEGSVVYLWCNNGSTPALSRKSLGANGSGGALGGAAGVVCGFKETSDIGDENYGVYSTHAPVSVASGSRVFRKWNITFSDDRETVRYTRGLANWDATSTATAAIYCLIDGKPCLSFEDPASIMGATGATVTADGQITADGIYLGTTPMEFYSSGFSAVAGLIVGQSGSANGLGGAALGDSNGAEGAMNTFGKPSTSDSNGGIAFFDFTREMFESNQRKELSDSETAGAYLYKTTEEGHDTTEPYAQKFIAPDALSDCEFTFYVNGTEYEFPSVWPNANKQTANSGEYVTYITGVHIGDTLTVVARYADGKRAGGIYTITMHSLVYGLYLGRYEFLWKDAGTYPIILPAGTYQTYIHGAGGSGGENGGNYDSYTGGAGGSGGVGKLSLKSFDLDDDTEVDVYVGAAGLTKTNGGNGGTRGLHTPGETGGADGGNGGGGGEPSYVLFLSTLLYALGGGGGGAGGGAARSGSHGYNYGAGGGAGGGFYRIDETTGDIISVPGADGGQGGSYSGNGYSGGVGNTTDFPNIYSGTGGTGGDWGGERRAGGASTSGGGAGGGGGGSNGKNADGSSGGVGGGGAGGDYDAGGGKKGNGSNFGGGSDAYNAKTTLTPTIDYRGNAVSSGWGMGGSVNMNGTDGWVYIVRCEDITEYLDMGLVYAYQPDIVNDAGLLNSSATETEDAGFIQGAAETMADAGSILIAVPSTPWDLGLITDDVTTIQNNGNIIGDLNG